MPFSRSPQMLSVFDLGSNSFQLLVAEKRPDGLVRAHRDTQFNNISEHREPDGSISSRGMELGLEAVARLIERAPVQAHSGQVVALATHAIRSATNGPQFLAAVEKQTGLKAKIITGEEAAKLAFLGATSEFPHLKSRRFVVADIGGGSTELAWGTPGKVTRAVCIHLGITALIQRLAQMPNTANIALDNLAIYVRRTVEAALTDVGEGPADVIVFASGVARVIGRLIVSYGLANPGTPIETRALRELIPLLLSASREDLLARGVPEERVNTVGPTAVVVEVIRDLFEHETFLVAQGGLREGAALRPDIVGLQTWPKAPRK
jgi:exopolyphosphatase / guanosine-5'-triphosphate,3'-diphosphate pyrophosphatase